MRAPVHQLRSSLRRDLAGLIKTATLKGFIILQYGRKLDPRCESECGACVSSYCVLVL